MYYKRSERHWRVAVFFGGAAVAGAFGGESRNWEWNLQSSPPLASTGVLAYGIGKMDGVGGKRGWAWYVFSMGGLEHHTDQDQFNRIFILEGNTNLLRESTPFAVLTILSLFLQDC